MVLFSIGLPGRFADWCDTVLSRLAQRAFGSVELIRAATLDELALDILRTRGSHFVASLHQPATRLRAALAETNQRFLVALEDPRNAVAHLMTRNGLDVVASTRNVANSCTAILDCLSIPGALALSSERGGWDLISTLEAIVRHFELPLDTEAIAEIAAELADAEIMAGETDHSAWWESREESERVLVNGALGAFAEHLAGGSFGSITWSPPLFIVGDRPGESPTRPIDVTGRARCLLYGPYILLPPGLWAASVVLGFSKEAAEFSYIVEIGPGFRASRTNLRPGSEGVFEVNLAFSIDEPTDEQVEMRVLAERAAFDGMLALGYVTLVKQMTTRSERLAGLASALGVGEG